MHVKSFGISWTAAAYFLTLVPSSSHSSGHRAASVPTPVSLTANRSRCPLSCRSRSRSECCGFCSPCPNTYMHVIAPCKYTQAFIPLTSSTVILQGEQVLAGFPRDSPSVHTSSVTPFPPCPSQTGEGTAVKNEEWKESIFHEG